MRRDGHQPICTQVNSAELLPTRALCPTPFSAWFRAFSTVCRSSPRQGSAPPSGHFLEEIFRGSSFGHLERLGEASEQFLHLGWWLAVALL